MQQRVRRKASRPLERRQEVERPAPPRKQKALRRSARLGPKGSWKFRDSSSEPEGDEESLNAPAARRNGQTSRPAMSKYITRSVRNSEAGRRNSGTVSTSQTMTRGPSLPKPPRSVFATALTSKRGKKGALKGHGLKDEYYEEEYEELFDNDGQLGSAFGRSRDQGGRKLDKAPAGEKVDGLTVWNLEVNVLSQIRKYLPYYNGHIPDARLCAFMELMERLNGIGVQHGTVQRVQGAAGVDVSQSGSMAKALAAVSEPDHTRRS